MEGTLITDGRRVGWSRAWPLLAMAAALGTAIIGALLTGTTISPVTGSVEGLSAGSGNLLDRISLLFPLGFAFSAGMVSSVNPCGFAMLPAYLGLFLGDEADDRGPRGPLARFQRAVLVGSSVTVGFVLMFAAVGAPIGLGARGLVNVFPWIGLGVGVVLTAAGAYLLSGGKLYSNVAASLSARLGNTGGGVRGYFVFGIAYGVASLSCTLPIFLAVVGSSFAAATFLDSLLQFLLYGLGMGFVILILTVSMAIFRGAMVRVLRSALPYVSQASAVLLLVAGAFIVYYWLTIGGLLDSF